MNAKDLKLDYFQIYDFENPRNVRGIASTIRLQGQFDEDGPEFAKLQYLKKLANPTQKKDEEFYNKPGHLVWYNMESFGADPAIGVQLENQFGKQEIVIYRDVGLLVPAQKRVMERGRKFSKPTKLDHYKIYEVVKFSRLDAKPFKVADQFQTREVQLGGVIAFAVPVKKRHHGEDFPIINAKTHLTIYRISYSKDLEKIVETRDQFGRYRFLKVGRSHMLAVPSVKLDWKILD